MPYEVYDRNGYNNIAAWLFPLLRKKRLSVENLANLAGLSRSTIYHYFTDRKRPSVESMAAICMVLSRPLSEGLKTYTDRVR